MVMGLMPVWRRDDAVLAGGGERAVSAVSGGAVYGGLRGVVSGDGGESVYGAVWAGGDVGAAAEFCAGVQSSGNDSGGVDWGAVHLFGRGEDGAGDGAMKAAGTYAAYLHTEIMRVVPTYLALGCGGAAVCVDACRG